jgi:hypothetical protein
MKKVILALLTVTTLGTTMSAPFISNAHEHKTAKKDRAIGFRELNSNSYEVLLRRNNRQSWFLHTYYPNRFEAEKVAFSLPDRPLQESPRPVE